MKRGRIVLAIACLVAGLVAAPADATATAEGSNCSAGVLVLRTLHVEGRPSKKKVHRGERFVVHATVTRPAEEDPAGQGIEYDRPASAPAEDVTVGVSIWVGEKTYFWGIGVTDENGEVDVPVRVPRNAELGWAYAALSARHWIKSDCPDILEEGYRNYEDFVKVLR